jgi:hypothetical protein
VITFAHERAQARSSDTISFDPSLAGRTITVNSVLIFTVTLAPTAGTSPTGRTATG